MAQAIPYKHQKVLSTGKPLQSHSFNKYHSAAKLDTARPIPSKNLFRMADKFRKTAKARSPQQSATDCAKTMPMPTEQQPEMVHLATEVVNDHGYDDELEP